MFSTGLETCSTTRSVSSSRHPKETWNPQEPLGISALIQRPTILSHYHRRSIYTIPPFTAPLSKPSILCPSNVSLSTSPHTMAASIWFLPFPSSSYSPEISSVPNHWDQIVPISSKGIYQVPGFCCKVVKKEMDNGNEKRDKSAQSKNVIELFGRRQIYSLLKCRSHTHDQTKRR